MSKSLRNAVFYLTAWLVSAGTLLAQTKLSGNITDANTREGLVGVSIQVKGKVIGTITDSKGNFSLTTSTPTPFALVVSSVAVSYTHLDVYKRQIPKSMEIFLQSIYAFSIKPFSVSV